MKMIMKEIIYIRFGNTKEYQLKNSKDNVGWALPTNSFKESLQ